MELVRTVCLEKGLAQKGDSVIVAAGMPLVGERFDNVETNMMFVQEL